MLNPVVLLSVEFFAAPCLHGPRKRTLKRMTIQEKRKTRNLEIWEWLGRVKQVFLQGSIYYELINFWKMFIGTHRNINTTWREGRYLALPCLQTQCKKRGLYCDECLNPEYREGKKLAFVSKCSRASILVRLEKIVFWFEYCIQIYILGLYAIFDLNIF